MNVSTDAKHICLQIQSTYGNSLLAGPQASEGDLHALGNDAVRGDACADVGGPVVGEGAAHVVSEVSKGALAGGLSLDDESHEGNHGKASVLDLLGLHGLHVALAEAKGIEDATGVSHDLVGDGVALEDRVL